MKLMLRLRKYLIPWRHLDMLRKRKMDKSLNIHEDQYNNILCGSTSFKVITMKQHEGCPKEHKAMRAVVRFETS